MVVHTTTKKDHKLLFLNSKNASIFNNSSKHSDVVFRLATPIFTPQEKILNARLASFVFHNSLQVINSTNNKLVMTDPSGVDYTMTITAGNYDATTLGTAIQTLANDLYPTTDPFTVTYNTSTFKYTFSHTVGNFTFKSTSTCLSLIGFPDGSSYTSTAKSLSSTYPANLSGENTLYIDIPSLDVTNINGTNGSKSSVIACIPVTEGAGSVCCYDNPHDTVFLVRKEAIYELHVKVYQEDLSTLADFQNQNWNMTIELQFSTI